MRFHVPGFTSILRHLDTSLPIFHFRSHAPLHPRSHPDFSPCPRVSPSPCQTVFSRYPVSPNPRVKRFPPVLSSQLLHHPPCESLGGKIPPQVSCSGLRIGDDAIKGILNGFGRPAKTLFLPSFSPHSLMCARALTREARRKQLRKISGGACAAL